MELVTNNNKSKLSAKKPVKAADDKKLHKIEGKAFLAVKAKKLAYKKTIEDAKKAVEKAHKELWAEVGKTVPATKGTDDNYVLDTEYEKLDFYVVKKSDQKPFSRMMAELLGMVE